VLRLRTTSGLSLLALAIGALGTGWLSGQTAGWAGPTPRGVAASARPRGGAHEPRLPARPRHAAPVVVVRAATSRRAPVQPMPADPAQAPSPMLVPVSTPADPAPYVALRGHLDGRVVLHVAIDGAGHVRHAAVSQSSGDPVLDAHALATVGGWRFAVPPDHPDGFSGELPMRFDTGERLAHAP
jgi:protein TonB